MDNILLTIQTHLEFLGYEVKEDDHNLYTTSNRSSMCAMWINKLLYI